MTAPVLAIDYGTSNSLVAAAANGKIIPPLAIDPEAPDPTVLRSVMFSPDKRSWYFGDAAINQYQDHSADGRLFRSVKKYLPEPSFTGTQLHGEFRTIVDLIAVFLREIRARAASVLGQESDAVVLGRPAVFSLNKGDDALAESRLRAAAIAAGFKHVMFLPEPLAAAYEFRHQLTEEKVVLVADFGGGTSDFTVLKMGPRELQDQDVLAIGGVPIAGDMFDGSIMRHQIAPHLGSQVVYRLPLGSIDLRLPNSLIAKMCSPADMSLLAHNDLLGVLKDAQRWSLEGEAAQKMNRLFVVVEEHLGYMIFRSIERAKISLSSNPSALFEFSHPGLELREELLTKDFQRNSQVHVDRIIESMDQTVAAAGLSYPDIDVVCFTGGTAKLPALRQELDARLGREKVQEHRHFHSVVGGLAEKAKSFR
jgi:hypothetical chaperone protein